MSTSATATAPGGPGGPGGGPVSPAAVFHNAMQNSLSNMTITAETSNGPFANPPAMASYPPAYTNDRPGMISYGYIQSFQCKELYTVRHQVVSQVLETIF